MARAPILPRSARACEADKGEVANQTRASYVTAVGDSPDESYNRNGTRMPSVSCQYCERELDADEVAIRLKVVRPPHGMRQWYGATYQTCCLGCGVEYAVSETSSAADCRRVAKRAGFESFLAWLQDEDTDPREVFTALYRADRCERCDRPLYLPRMDRRVAQVCHPTCEGRRQFVCATCGDGFTPARSDARHCNDACRQKAYRQRKKGD